MSQPLALRLLAPAKLNLTLDVLHRREDGYHELDMLMIGISLFDRLYMAPAPYCKVRYTGLHVPAALTAASADDTVRRAIAAYSARAGKACGAVVHVHKNIPAEAGLGGGSADAAAVLRGMQRMYHALSQDDLHAAALEVGADVPYCLHNDACRAGGVGEKLMFLRIAHAPFWFVLLKPSGGISTGRLFSSLRLPVQHPNTDAAQHALIAGDIVSLGKAVGNALQPAAAAQLPEINAYCDRLLRAGALGAAMTGSGSAVFGLFSYKAAADAAYALFPDAGFRAVCSSIHRIHVSHL